MSISDGNEGGGKKPIKKQGNGGIKGNVGHVREVAVKNAVESFMRHYGDSGIEARDRVRSILGQDFKSLSAPHQRDWPDIIQRNDPFIPRQSGYGGGGGGGGVGGGGGGGGVPVPVVAPPKIRTSTGIRRSPYWESEDPIGGGFTPRFVVLGDSGQW